MKQLTEIYTGISFLFYGKGPNNVAKCSIKNHNKHQSNLVGLASGIQKIKSRVTVTVLQIQIMH